MKYKLCFWTPWHKRWEQSGEYPGEYNLEDLGFIIAAQFNIKPQVEYTGFLI